MTPRDGAPDGIVELKDAERPQGMDEHLVAAGRAGALRPDVGHGSAEIDSTLTTHRFDMISTDGDYVAELLKLFKQR